MSNQWATVAFVDQSSTDNHQILDTGCTLTVSRTYQSVNGIKPCRDWARTMCKVLIENRRGLNEIYVTFSDDTAWIYKPNAGGWHEVQDLPEGVSISCANEGCEEEALSTRIGSRCVDHAYEASIPSDGIWALHNGE